MDEVRLPYQPKILDIKKEDLFDSILNVRKYVQSRPKLWYTVINDSTITKEWAVHAIKDLQFG
jgi:hypothetical protein